MISWPTECAISILVMGSITVGVTGRLKVSKSQKHFFLKLEIIFRSLFGQWIFKKNCFWDLLTFTVMGFAYTVGPSLFLYKWSLTKNHAALILSSTQNSVLRMKLSTFTKWIFDKNMEQETIVRLERSSLVLTHYSESWALGCPVWATHWRYYCDPGHLVFTSRDLTIFFLPRGHFH